MTYVQAVIFGIIQGLTEFIPVSSTAHLLIGQKLMGIPANNQTTAFLVIIQLGTLVSLFAFEWRDLTNIFIDTLKNLGRVHRFQELPFNAKMGWYIIIATIPALLAGFLLRNVVKVMFAQPALEAGIRLLSAAILLFLAERLTRKERPLESVTWLDALVIGLFQIIAVFPGASRSGTTISGGLFRGLDRKASARFAFLMSVPVLLAAGGYEMIGVIRSHSLDHFLPTVAIGFITAAIVGWFAIRWLIAHLSKNYLYGFAAYCAALGLISIFIIH